MPFRLLALLLALADAQVVERVLAVVDFRPVLLSEAGALSEVRGVSLEDALRLLIDERLMYALVSRVPQAAVSDADADAAVQALVERKPDLRTRVDETELRRLAIRQLAILRYLDFRFRPQIRPTDEELQSAYEEEYGGQPDAPAFSAVAAELREALVRRQLDQKVEAWIGELRAAAQIRYVTP